MKNLATPLFIALSLSACVVPPPPAPGPGPALKLNFDQVANLRILLELTPSSPFTVTVLDQDIDGQLSGGDIAIVNGGVANAEVKRRVLSNSDVVIVNASTGNALVEATRQLREAEAKWRRILPVYYTYTLQRSCFCTHEYLQPIDIRVYNGLVQEATVRPANRPLPPERRSEALTVEGLFRLIQEAIDRKAAAVVVTYDPYYGYPVTISLDYDVMVADEEIALTASNFNPRR